MRKFRLEKSVLFDDARAKLLRLRQSLLALTVGRRNLATDGGVVPMASTISSIIGRSGEKPTDLPVQQVTKIQLVIILKTGKALGPAVAKLLLATADEVIQ
jgi:hypothetical protein